MVTVTLGVTLAFWLASLNWCFEPSFIFDFDFGSVRLGAFSDFSTFPTFCCNPKMFAKVFWVRVSFVPLGFFSLNFHTSNMQHKYAHIYRVCHKSAHSEPQAAAAVRRLTF